jgi:PDZ domain-containing protein
LLYYPTEFANLYKQIAQFIGQVSFNRKTRQTKQTILLGGFVMPRQFATACTLAITLLCGIPVSVSADNAIELPVLAAVRQNNLGVFEILMMWWDKKPEPNPVQLQWLLAGVRLGNDHLGAMAQAFAYAVERTPSIQHSGTVSVQGVAYRPTGSDGPSAGAAMAVGFIAMFKGDHLQRGIALTGTIEPGGQIGPVGSIPDKIRAAVREGYRTVLVPRGQMHDPQWNLTELGFQLNVTVKEVDTVDEAYEMMTGQRI